MVYATVFLELLFAMVLSVAGAAKLDRPWLFAAALRAHGALPPWSASIVSFFLPWLELALALGLALGIATRLVAFGIMLLFMGFALYKGFLYLAHRPTSCACMGEIQTKRSQAVDMTVSVIYGVLAITLLIVTIAGHAPSPNLRVTIAAIILSIVCVMGVRVVSRRLQRRGFIRGTAAYKSS